MPMYLAQLQDGVTRLRNEVASGGSGLATGSFADVLQSIILFILSLAAILALGALIAGGIMYIVALGDEQRVARAKKIVLYALIGLLLAGASVTIVVAVGTIFR